jgi:hypothetical protein
VTVSDSPAARNLSGQSKKIGSGCPHCFRGTDSRYSPMKHQFWNMKDQFNGNTEKRHPPLHLIGHEVYEMVKDVHVLLGKWKMTGKNTEEDDIWKKKSIF